MRLPAILVPAMRVTFLGTGTSRGIPVVGCGCGVCRSSDPRNQRLRCSLLVESAETVVVVDTSSDFRQQMLRHQVRRLDAVVLTHHHADHVLGLDDVFPFYMRAGKALPLYGGLNTLQEVRTTFRHLFSGPMASRAARLDPREINGAFSVGDLQFRPLRVLHGSLPIHGYRIGGFAYLTDVSNIPDETYAALEGLDCLALDGLRFRPHPTHFSIPEAVEVAMRVGATRSYLIHMCHDVDHQTLGSQLPEGIEPAYDGLALEFRQGEQK
jgi:phosphoribosyl 1,2-cyclic phosphate phosphodiesterase